MPKIKDSGPLGLQDVNVAFGYPPTNEQDLDGFDFRDLVGKPDPGTQVALSEAYGKTPDIKIKVGQANSTLYNINLREYAQETRPGLFDAGEPTGIVFTFNVFGNIGSRSLTEYAVRTGEWHPTVRLILNVPPVRTAANELMDVNIDGETKGTMKVKDYFNPLTKKWVYKTVGKPKNKNTYGTFVDLVTFNPPNGIIAGMGSDATQSGCCDCNHCGIYNKSGGSAILMEHSLSIDNQGIIGSGGTGGHGITMNRDNPRTGGAGGGAGIPGGKGYGGAYVSDPNPTILNAGSSCGQAGGSLGMGNAAGRRTRPAILTQGYTLTYIDEGLIRGDVLAAMPGGIN
jgi:hypothetical protein